MSWKDQLQPASFRGVSFYVGDAEALFGRRNQLHEYPYKDIPFAEDFGKKAREFTINAYVIGEEYIGVRDQLIMAVEEDPTPGTLIHPTLGQKTVVPKDCRVVYSNQEGGIERFVLTFVEAGENTYPLAEEDTQELVSLTSFTAIDSIVNNFADNFTINGYPSFVSDNAKVIIDDVIDAIEGAVKFGVTLKSKASALFNSINQYRSKYSSLLKKPKELGVGIADLITAIPSAYPSKRTVIYAIRKTLTVGNSYKQVPMTTPSRKQQYKNQIALLNLVKNLAVTQIAVSASQVEYSSKTEASTFKNLIQSDMEGLLVQLGDQGNDEQYQAVESLKSVLIKDISTRALLLPNLVTFNTKESAPALVTAYDIYEEAGKDLDLVERNRIRNPNFMPSYSPLEVLL